MSHSSAATTSHWVLDMSSVTPIVIAAFNAVDHLRRCVRTLEENTKAPYKLYIADDHSTDPAMQPLLDELAASERALVLRSKIQRGFGGINNWAVSRIATSNAFLLLNSDIEPLEGWLLAMTQELEEPDVGIVGARLVYPETKGKPWGLTIQHAGVARTSLGYPFHPFRGEPRDFPQAAVRREINAVTAACILIRRSVWDQLNGFDPQFVGGQFEDVDFCWRARKADWRVVYQPKATLYHFEHGSGEEWVEKSSAANCKRLREKWEWIKSDEYLFGDGAELV